MGAPGYPHGLVRDAALLTLDRPLPYTPLHVATGKAARGLRAALNATSAKGRSDSVRSGDSGGRW
ncbi:hypothetical protein ACSNOK_11055 [Streptomyces sp. URMC 126]|uniref:hypothetical protein n=1 Tax=Streptomyces sp. URMC 126 TaxID=3423401 RepID=UPI003F1B8182